MTASIDISTTKQRYRELFALAHTRMQRVFAERHAVYRCAACRTGPEAVDTVLHAGCGYRTWQEDVVYTLQNVVGKQVVESLERIEAARTELGGCHQCAACCRLASSEFSYAELQAKAAAGDGFATQFTRVFLPYASANAARAVMPDAVEEILSQTDETVYFYHCPYVSDDNQCTIYTHPHRPALCASYPEMPLIFLHKTCGFQPWKEAMLPTTLLAQATLELCQYYAFRVLDCLKDPGQAVSDVSA